MENVSFTFEDAQRISNTVLAQERSKYAVKPVDLTSQADELVIINVTATTKYADGTQNGNLSYWRVAMVLHVIVPNSWSNLPENASPGFDARLRNVGFNAKISGANPALAPITPGAKVPSDLDETGYKLGNVDPIYLKFNVHPRANLAWVNKFLSSGAF